MKKIAIALLSVFMISSCSQEAPKEKKTNLFTGDIKKENHIAFGEDLVLENKKVYKMSAFNELTKGKENEELILAGTIDKVCTKKGCWMSMKNPNGESVFVSYDYKFLLPINVDGRNAILKGVVSNDTTSVKDLKHYAEDAGKTEAEIAKITEPKIEKTILASTVWIKK
ncbi:MAG: DUF4920 domain-containing protein [Flavobacteriales bacterium]|jgi:hypothetical protein|nr:DUF4920 domain-containing protein [Flavobacteriales bacterium]